MNYLNKIIKNCDTNTIEISATGYVAAYADATFSVPAVLMRVPSAGVEVMPPVIEPRLLSKLSFSTYLAKMNPSIIGTIVIIMP